jgi:hypothetical protein
MPIDRPGPDYDRVMTPDRDIDYVIVTGAGASREFGVDGKKFPLMGDWSNALVQALLNGSASYLKATGLAADMPGIDSESSCAMPSRSSRSAI